MRIAGIILILISIATFGYWAASGMLLATTYQETQEQTIVDDFGDEETKTVLVDKFTFGLTPTDKYYDGALPIGGPTGGLGLALLIFGTIRARKE